MANEAESKAFLQALSKGRVHADITYNFGEGDSPHHEKSREIMGPFYGEIVAIAHQWSMLEHAIDETCWHLVGTTPFQGACLSSQIVSTFAKVKALTALVALWPDTDALVTKLNKFSASIEAGVKKRNRAVHDPIGYAVELNAVITHRITADKKLDMGFALAKLDDYLEARKHIKKIRQAFNELRLEIIVHVSSVEKPPQLLRPSIRARRRESESKTP